MKKLILCISVLVAFTTYGQEDEGELSQDWSRSGKFQVLFNQSAFNQEWTGGGTSSVAGNLAADIQFNYKKKDLTWDTRLRANYGLTKLNGEPYLRKTSDRLEVNSIAGKQLKNSLWHYSIFTNFRTQITTGYEFYEDPVTGREERYEFTHFLSPAYLQAGPGLMWKKSENLRMNIAPATSRLLFVDEDFTSVPGYQDGAYFGVAQGKNVKYEFGASLSGYAKFDLMTDVSAENSVSLYSNYLDQPGNVDIDYLFNLDMAINDLLSANLIFQAIYDDDTIEAFQIREVFGAGLNYIF